MRDAVMFLLSFALCTAGAAVLTSPLWAPCAVLGLVGWMVSR